MLHIRRNPLLGALEKSKKYVKRNEFYTDFGINTTKSLSRRSMPFDISHKKEKFIQNICSPDFTWKYAKNSFVLSLLFSFIRQDFHWTLKANCFPHFLVTILPISRKLRDINTYKVYLSSNVAIWFAVYVKYEISFIWIFHPINLIRLWIHSNK